MLNHGWAARDWESGDAIEVGDVVMLGPNVGPKFRVRSFAGGMVVISPEVGGEWVTVRKGRCRKWTS